MRSKDEIVKDYDETNIPYPIRNLVKLDYCWKLNATLWRHSIYLSFPLTGIYFIYTRMPDCWNYTRKTFPLRALAINYVAIMCTINLLNTTYSLAFEDYCKRNSAIYDTKLRNARVLRGLIKDTNTEHKKTYAG